MGGLENTVKGSMGDFQNIKYRQTLGVRKLSQRNIGDPRYIFDVYQP